jgi:hypothetical protein
VASKKSQSFYAADTDVALAKQGKSTFGRVIWSHHPHLVVIDNLYLYPRSSDAAQDGKLSSQLERLG